MRTRNHRIQNLGWERRKLPEVNYLHANPAAALIAVKDDWHYWSQRVTEYSYALAIGLIGGNWAVFGTVEKISNNLWALISVGLVLVSLWWSLVGAVWLARLHGERVDHAEKDAERWGQEYKGSRGGANGAWPFDKEIEVVAKCLKWSRFLLIYSAAFCFVVAVCNR